MSNTSSRLMPSEWLSANLSKAYPFDDSVGGSPSGLSTTLFTDAFILVSDAPSDDSISSAHISSLTNTGKSLLISIELMTRANNSYGFEHAIEITFDSDDYHTAEFSSTADGITIFGSITVGLMRSIKNQPGLSGLTTSDTKFFDGVVRVLPATANNGLESITIGGVTLTGDVVLELGDGLSVTQIDDSTAKIELEGYALPEENGIITTDDDLLAALVEKYGTPIRSINGVLPDSEGAFVFGSGDDYTGEDRYKYAHIVVSSGDGPGTIRLKLALDPCLELEDVRSLVTSIERLNDRSAHLDAAQTALDNAVGSVATQLTRLG